MPANTGLLSGRYFCAVAALICCSVVSTAAQQTEPAAGADSAAADSSASSRPELYRIGPRDVVSVRVTAGRYVPELSLDSAEVDECGRIPLPSVQHEEQNEVRAAGKTRYELADELRAFYKKYKKNPQVVVTIKEYNSQPVAINGAVVKPSQFQLRRQVRLMELLQFYAGGPTDRAGGRIQIARMPELSMCDEIASSSDGSGIEFLDLNLSDTLAGVEEANPILRPGDIITVPTAKEAYVVGNVLRPGSILLREDRITVSQAVAMAGGTMPDTKKGKVRVIRKDTKTGAKTELFVDLDAIDKHKAEDIALQANDIIDVPTSGGKRMLRSLIGTIVPTVGQLPVQVIR